MTKPSVKTIAVTELKNRLEADENLCLIDVRELSEWQTVRIPGALHIPKDELPHCIEARIPDYNKPIYLHCKGGVRSLHAANCLIEIGYQNVYSVDGGIAEWARLGYPVET